MLGRLRLISGFLLFVFVLGHFSNHMLGIVSLRAMDEAWYYTIEPWRTLPGTLILLGALSVHAGLATWSLIVRRSLRMKRWEFFQLASGFLIPVMLAAHVLSARGGYEAFGLETGYGFQIYSQWVQSPLYGFIDLLALMVVWIHSCIGWHFWLRLKPWYAKYFNLAFAFAVAVPVLAIAGIVSGGFRVLRLAQNEKWVAGVFKKLGDRAPEYSEFVYGFEDKIQLSILLLLFSIAVIHAVRRIPAFASSDQTLTCRSIEMDGRRSFKLQPGASVLDMIKDNGLPHASVCGGRGRCSTCRIRIDEGMETLGNASDLEKKVLNRIGAPENVRLACQIYPKTSLSVTALLNADATPQDGFENSRISYGEEQEIAVLFADIRAFTKISEEKLPYDTAFLLNRYFEAMGSAIESEGGHLDKFIGDGVMALFGIDRPLEEGCKQALAAAMKMSGRLEQLNGALQQDLSEPLRIGIGIHCGTAIVGNLGYGRASNLTAIGDVVNTSSRLESLTKEYKVQLIVSEKVASVSGIDVSETETESVTVRGRDEPLSVCFFQSGKDLNEFMKST